VTLAAPALAGIRVLDFSRMLSGPFCTALLADLGADVIKIESPDGGDDARHFAPKSGGESCLFMMVNRNKRSVTLDLKSEADRQVAHRLAERSDIVVENFRPGVARRLGVDYASLAAINRRLVYASISGFGQEGPLAHRPAYDIIAQAMGGIMSVNGSKDGPPTRVGESLGDLAAGLYAAWAILAGLRARDRDGHGQHLDIAMLDSIFSLLVSALSQYLFTGESPGRIGNANPISAPLDSFRAADGELIIAVANDVMFRRLCQAMDAPELADDPRFAIDAARKQNETALKALIEAWTGSRTVEAVVGRLEAASVPASPILSVSQVAESTHAAHRRLVRTVRHATAGTVPVVLQPVQFLGAESGPCRSAPLLGQHTEEVLIELQTRAPVGKPA
jgi:CoA:oxalate CoA-transferase